MKKLLFLTGATLGLAAISSPAHAFWNVPIGDGMCATIAYIDGKAELIDIYPCRREVANLHQ